MTPPHGRRVASPPLEFPEAPLWQILAGTARRWPDRPALVSATEVLSWSDLWTLGTRVAQGLRGRGVRPGDVVALQMGNCVDFAAAYWGAQLVGATVSPVNPLQAPAEIEHQLADCGATLVILSEKLDTATALPAVSVTELSGDGGATVITARPHEPADCRAAIAHISYTGGTTGVPKGVLVSQYGVVTNALQFSHWSSGSVPARDADDGVVLHQIGSATDWPVRLGTGTVIAVAPWFHAMGLGGGLVVGALHGHTSVLLGRFDPARFLAALEQHRVTSVSGSPALLAGLARALEANPQDTSSVRLLSCGGGPLPTALHDRLRPVFPEAVVTQAYGLTEVMMAATGNPTGRSQERRPGSVGRPLPGTEVMVAPAEPGSSGGEILIRGPQVMLAYLGRPQETADVLEDGWLRTGDVGVLDDDGYLTIVDRAKDMLIYKGYNIYPSELERLLKEQPGVTDAAVVGVADPDIGDLPVAFVVADYPDIDLDALQANINDAVVHYKRLRAIYLVDGFPISAMGKVLKTALRQEAAHRRVAALER